MPNVHEPSHPAPPIFVAIRLAFASVLGLAVLFAAFSAYLSLIYFLVAYSNLGVFLRSTPNWLVGTLALSTSFLAAASVGRFRAGHRARSAYFGAATSASSVLMGGAVIGCSCSAPILATILYAVGLSSFAVSDIVVSLAFYQLPIVLSLAVGNLLLTIRALYQTAMAIGEPSSGPRQGDNERRGIGRRKEP